MCGVLPSGYLSYCTVRSMRLLFNGHPWLVLCISLMCNFKLATQLSTVNFTFFLSFCFLVGGPNKSSEKTNCNAGLISSLKEISLLYLTPASLKF